MRTAIAVVMVVGAVTGCSAPASQEQGVHPLVGTWELVEWRAQDSLGVWQEAFGSDPRGYFVYGEGGYLSIHLMHEDGAGVEGCEPSSEGPDANLDAESFLVLPWCYAGYFGKYRIEPGDSIVVHLPEGGTILSYIGTEQPRKFELRGDSLWIEPSETVYRLLLRVN